MKIDWINSWNAGNKKEKIAPRAIQHNQANFY